MSGEAIVKQYWSRKHGCFVPIGQDAPVEGKMTLDSFLKNVPQKSHKDKPKIAR